MSAIKKALQADRRLVILRLLKESGGSANARVIQIGLKAWLHKVSLDVIVNDLNFMADYELIRIEATPKPQYSGATITSKGKEVAEGLRKIDGIAEPEV